MNVIGRLLWWGYLEPPKRMYMTSEKSTDKSSWAIGGCTLIGLGAGFVFLQTSILWFVASVLIGIGLGLVLAAFISLVQKST